MVLSSGKIEEFDSPENLINKKGSLFADLVNKSNIKKEKNN